MTPPTVGAPTTATVNPAVGVQTPPPAPVVSVPSPPPAPVVTVPSPPPAPVVAAPVIPGTTASPAALAPVVPGAPTLQPVLPGTPSLQPVTPGLTPTLTTPSPAVRGAPGTTAMPVPIPGPTAMPVLNPAVQPVVVAPVAPGGQRVDRLEYEYFFLFCRRHRCLCRRFRCKSSLPVACCLLERYHMWR